ncbi:MAG: hypothetical protein ABJE95_29205 [Byssovorax sp.]
MSQKRPANLRPSMSPHVTWVHVTPDDVLSATRTLGALNQEGRMIAYRGEDVDSLLSWGLAELNLAENTVVKEDQRRHTSQAVVHAKKAIDCIFDAYLERDFLDVHLGARPTFKSKLLLLKERLGNQVPWRLIPTIVARPRDSSEHERRAPTLEEAGVAVEAARVIVAAMISANHPLRGPAIAGSFSGGASSGPWGYHVYVESFSKYFGWLWRCADGVPRAGVGVATADDIAEVSYADLQEFGKLKHLELMRIWDGFPISSWVSELFLREKIKLAGLDQPA